MAVFPQIPRNTIVELFIANNWVDVTSDVYARDGITITRGARDETSRAEPSRCRLTLNNRSGKNSPRNPVGPYYGSIGRNTPLRVTIGKDSDTFTRTVSSGWGSTDLGSAWSTFGHGGTIAASDYNVGSGAGTHSVPATNADRNTYLGGPTYTDVDVTVTVSLTLPSVTGAGVSPANLMFRGSGPSDYILLSLVVDATTNTYGLEWYDVISGTFVSISDPIDTGIPYTASTPLRVRAQTENLIVRTKIWPAASPEPYLWHLSAASNILRAGWVGIQSFVFTGNTNTLPVVYTYDNLVVRIPRYAGEVSYWPQRWDTSGIDIYVPIEASGIKRRLGQGTAPVSSAMLTAITTLPIPPISYWPCEDGAAAVEISPMIGANPMVITGSTKFADFGGFACSQALPTINVSTWRGRVPTYTSSGAVTLQYLLHVSSSEPADNFPISQLFTTGTAPQYEIKYRTGGFFQINVWSPAGIIYDSGTLSFAFPDDTLIDSLWLVCLRLNQNGSNVDLILDAMKVGDSVLTASWSTTLTSRTIGVAQNVVIDPFQKMRGVSVGHIVVRNEVGDVFDSTDGLNAFSGPPELGGMTAADRIFRLAEAAGITTDVVGSPPFTEKVGPQRPLPLLTLLEDAADADMGILHEPRGDLGLVYRTRASMYNQDPALTLNYAAGQVAPPLEPVDDDQQTRNDVIAKRIDGGEFELFLSSGRLSIADPWNGGVGLYVDNPSLNVDFDTQLPDIAGWRLLLGTVDEARYPTISVNLANLNVVNAGLDNAALGVNVGDRIVITNPLAGSTPDPISQIVRGYTEVIGVFEHIISFVCAPAAPYEIVRIGVPGKAAVDSATSTLASSVTTTGTSFSVATAAGNALWKTGSVSLDLGVGGEKVTVTNISGTSSPQTFTVVRSVNGVVKSHSAGVPIRLFRPALAGL